MPLTQGGKGVSLELARLVAKMFPEAGLIVPDSLPINLEDPTASNVELLSRWISDYYNRDNSFRKWILRSSHLEEDWTDSRCGLHDSKYRDFIPGNFNFESELTFIVEQLEKQVQRALFQPLYAGVGYVVDFCYSEILQQSVIHIASGRYMYDSEDCTSATNDLEAEHAIYSLDGELLIQSDSYLSEGIEKVAARIIPLAKLPLWFGWQIELILHPRDEEAKIYLVSVRPSPEPIISDSIPSLPTEDPLFETIRLSHATTVEGELVEIGSFWRNDPFRDFEKTCRGAGSSYKKVEEDPRIKDKIIFCPSSILSKHHLDLYY